MTEDEQQQIVRNNFQIGFRDLYERDITVANDADVRMGTFVLCAAFLDVLSLTYSAGTKEKGKTAEAKWTRFVTRYFGQEYAFLRNGYPSFRSNLLHNYSAQGIFFTHGPDRDHLHCVVDPHGPVWMHRESFVRDVLAALDRFESDALSDEDLRVRVIAHWKRFPPMGLAIRVDPKTGLISKAT